MRASQDKKKNSEVAATGAEAIEEVAAAVATAVATAAAAATVYNTGTHIMAYMGIPGRGMLKMSISGCGTTRTSGCLGDRTKRRARKKANPSGLTNILIVRIVRSVWGWHFRWGEVYKVWRGAIFCRFLLLRGCVSWISSQLEEVTVDETSKIAQRCKYFYLPRMSDLGFLNSGAVSNC